MKNTVTYIAVLALMFSVEPSRAKSAEKVHNVFKVSTVHKSANKKGESRDNSSVRNAKQLSEDQQSILKRAYKVAKKDGLNNPAILPGIIMQESRAGDANKFRTSRHKSRKDQSVGVSQLLASTAKSVINEYPELKQEFKVSDKITEVDIHRRLATDDNFSIAIASKYLKTLYHIKNDDTWVAAAYNRGPAKVPKTPWKLEYVRLVFAHIQKYKSYFA